MSLFKNKNKKNLYLISQKEGWEEKQEGSREKRAGINVERFIESLKALGTKRLLSWSLVAQK